MLLLLLGLPVALYIFLQEFGDNNYQVPIFYQDGITNPLNKDCNLMEGEHMVSNFVVTSSNLDKILNQKSILVVAFAQASCDENVLPELARVCNQFKQREDFNALTLAVDSTASDESQLQLTKSYAIPEQKWSWSSFSNIENLVNCGFNLEVTCNLSNQLVLIDKQSRIRGYYLVQDPEELDRLITEVNILFREYADK